MRSAKEFRNFYDLTLHPKLVEVDRLRKLKLKRSIYSLLSVLGLVIFIVIGLSQSWLPGTFKLVWIGIVIVAFIILIYRLNKGASDKSFKSAFKRQAIESIVNFISQDLIYAPKKKIRRGLYEKSRIFLQSIDRYNGDDLIEGEIDKTLFHFSELHTRYKTTNSKGQTTWHDVFKGLFFVADFNKNFDGSTVLVPNSMGGGFTFLKKIFGLNRKEKLVELADPKFTENFTCYSTDDIMARYILTPALMHRLNGFHEKYPNNRVALSFVDGQIFVAISYPKKLFEPSLFRSVVEFSRVKSYFDDIRLVVEIVDDLNLNNRIWTKQ
jgi:hypothetical protein